MRTDWGCCWSRLTNGWPDCWRFPRSKPACGRWAGCRAESLPSKRRRLRRSTMSRWFRWDDMLTDVRDMTASCWDLRQWTRGNFGEVSSNWLEHWKNSRLHLEVRTQWVAFERVGPGIG